MLGYFLQKLAVIFQNLIKIQFLDGTLSPEDRDFLLTNLEEDSDAEESAEEEEGEEGDSDAEESEVEDEEPVDAPKQRKSRRLGSKATLADSHS